MDKCFKCGEETEEVHHYINELELLCEDCYLECLSQNEITIRTITIGDKTMYFYEIDIDYHTTKQSTARETLRAETIDELVQKLASTLKFLQENAIEVIALKIFKRKEGCDIKHTL